MKKTSILKSFVALLIGTVTITSCTNQDSLFGNELVPPGQGLATVIDSTMRVEASIFELDSTITSNNAGLTFLGSVWNPTTGLTTANIWSTYVPGAFDSNDSPYLFGIDPVLDSMFMILNFSNVKGDTSQKLKISVHEIKDTMLRISQLYYSNFAGENNYKPEPLFEFELSGGAQYLKQHIPREYFERLLFNDKDTGTNPFDSDSLFINMFNGFYFKVQPVAPPVVGAIYRVNMGNSTLQLHYHNKNTAPDTTLVNFQFYESGRKSVSLYTIENNYLLADPSQGGVKIEQIDDSTIQPQVLYVTGMAGLGARVVIDTTHIEQLRQKTIDAGFKHIAIQRAAIRWYLKEPTPEKYKWIPSRICLYNDFDNYIGVADYDPAREAIANLNYTSDIGGEINRSNGYYEQVITSTLQKLVNRAPNAKNIVQLLPSDAESYNYGYVTLNGSSAQDMAPTIVIVYTMLK